MTNVSLDYLKQTLAIFFEANQRENKTVKISKNGPDTQINRAIYELENHLYELKKEHDINLALNSDISSDHIRESFDQEAPQQYRKADYEYNFLLFLTYEYKPEHEVRHYIRDFIDAFRQNMSWMDLVITETRATRAFTNIRFAIDALRKKGLLDKRGHNNENEKLHPTLYGLLVLLYIKYHVQKEVSENSPYPFTSAHYGPSVWSHQYVQKATNVLNQPEEARKFFDELLAIHEDGMHVLSRIISRLPYTTYSNRPVVDMASLARSSEIEILHEERLSRTKLLAPFVKLLKES